MTLIILVFFLFSFASRSEAYTTNMNASVVVGQANFTSSSANQGGGVGANGFNNPYAVHSDGKRLFVADYSNHRVLIYNSIPSSNNAAADIVIGQTNFINNSANQGGSAAANTLNNPAPITSAGSKLIIADSSNKRILIYNSIPTSNNVSADVVIGQPNMTTTSTGTTACKFSTTWGVHYDSITGKLIISDYGNNRILIYNTVPSINGACADVVVGQNDFTSGSGNQGLGSPTAATLSNPYIGRIFDGKLLVVDTSNQRVLIWSSIPTTNGSSANIVVGQQNFTSNSRNQGGSPAANTLGTPTDVYFDGKRLFILENFNARVTIFNGILSNNNASAYQVVGQATFTSSNSNQGGSPGANTLSKTDGGFYVGNNQLVVTDQKNHRLLIFNNIIKDLGLSLNNSPERAAGDKVRLRGTATVDSMYTVQSVDYSINAGPWNGAIATDGSFGSTREEFYFDFDPNSNKVNALPQHRGNYTVRVRSTNSNLDETDHLFYFQPFTTNYPGKNSLLTTTIPSLSTLPTLTKSPQDASHPAFSFTVNKERLQDLKDHLSKYQIQIKKAGSNDWLPYLDIPVDYEPLRNSSENKERNVLSPGSDGIYEDNTKWINYTSGTATITAYGKDTDSSSHTPITKYLEDGGTKLKSGTYKWRVVAIDRANHTQEAEERILRVNTHEVSSSQRFFPLSLLNLSGYGATNLSTEDPTQPTTRNLQLTTTTPTFYGIAVVGSTVTLTLTETNCSSSPGFSCTQTFSTTTNPNSRFGINVSKGALSSGKTYTATLSTTQGDDYNELPTFTIKIQSLPTPTLIEEPLSPSSTTKEEPSLKPTPIPTPIATPRPTPQS